MITVTPITTPNQGFGRWAVAASADADDTAHVPTAFVAGDLPRVVVVITPVNPVARKSGWVWSGWQVTEAGVAELLLDKSTDEGTGLAADEGTPAQIEVTAYVAP